LLCHVSTSLLTRRASLYPPAIHAHKSQSDISELVEFLGNRVRTLLVGGLSLGKRVHAACDPVRRTRP
jgi:hypothetical protein